MAFFLLNGLSNWAESCIAVIAIWKGSVQLAQCFLVGFVAVNSLYLPGACFVAGVQHEDQPDYPMLMITLRGSALAASLMFAIIPAASNYNGKLTPIWYTRTECIEQTPRHLLST